MTLTLWYVGNDTSITIPSVVSIKLIQDGILEYRVYGDCPETILRVAGFTVTYNKG